MFIQEKFHASKSFRKIYLLKAESAKLDIKRRKLGILFIRIRLRFSHSKYLLLMIIFFIFMNVLSVIYLAMQVILGSKYFEPFYKNLLFITLSFLNQCYCLRFTAVVIFVLKHVTFSATFGPVEVRRHQQKTRL